VLYPWGMADFPPFMRASANRIAARFQHTPSIEGDECFIPKGTRISGRAVAGTRTVHAFGGHRADRAS
jgi:hypothetical protein